MTTRQQQQQHKTQHNNNNNSNTHHQPLDRVVQGDAGPGGQEAQGLRDRARYQAELHIRR